ncbi:MAG TPA: hypothetical protein VFI98_02995 [Pseudolabrys sp.]|nr:hypothetical protein [Pseudolabrys sp.]
MAKRKTIVETSSDAAANSDETPEREHNAELPFFQSPSVSPAESEPAEAVIADTPAPVVAAEITEAEAPDLAVNSEEMKAPISARVRSLLARRPKFALRPRHKRYAVLAVSVAVAAAVGAVSGIAATGGWSKRATTIARVDESTAAQQSIARLTREISGLKASLEAANKSAHSQFAKISDRLNRESAEITGTVTPPQTVPPASAPLPAPRPQTAAAEATRPSVVLDWSIREMRDGYVYVQGHGDIYQVVPGAPLPGLGPVEQIKRQDGRWVVVTPKGIIVSMRDRRYFE